MTQHGHKSASAAQADTGKPVGPTKVAVAASNNERGEKLASDEDVRLCAYRKWEAAGKPNGDGVRFWLEAEQELAQRQNETITRGGDWPGDREHERQVAEKTVNDRNVSVGSHYRDNNRMFQSHGERGHRHGGSG